MVDEEAEIAFAVAFVNDLRRDQRPIEDEGQTRSDCDRLKAIGNAEPLAKRDVRIERTRNRRLELFVVAGDKHMSRGRNGEHVVQLSGGRAHEDAVQVVTGALSQRDRGLNDRVTENKLRRRDALATVAEA